MRDERRRLCLHPSSLIPPKWGPKPMRYQPIENHGIIGNMHSAALVSLEGSVDWLCLPRFDSPSVFGALLDAEKGGRFRIAPAAGGELRRKQYYWPDTNVLITRFLHPDGIAEVEDYMPVGPGAGPDAQLVRRVRVIRGRLPLEVECRPAFDSPRAKTRPEGGGGAAGCRWRWSAARRSTTPGPNTRPK